MVTIREYEHALYDASRSVGRRFRHNHETVAGAPGMTYSSPYEHGLERLADHRYQEHSAVTRES